METQSEGEILSNSEIRENIQKGNSGDVTILKPTSGTTGRAKAPAIFNRSILLCAMNTKLARCWLSGSCDLAYDDICWNYKKLNEKESIKFIELR